VKNMLVGEIVVLFALPLAVCGADLYVAPNGNDAWSGRFAEPQPNGDDGPLASLVGARDRLRAIRSRQSPEPPGPLTVHLRGGMYTLAKTFELGSSDSGSKSHPVIYRNYGDEQVRVIGGRAIDRFAPVTDASILARLDESARGKVVQADLKAQGISDLGDPVAAGKRLELFFQDRPMSLARWPNEGFTQIAAVVGGELFTSHGREGDKIGKFTYEGDRPSRWKDETDIRLLGYWFWDWADAYQTVESIDTDSRVIHLKAPYHHYGYRKGQRFYAINLLAELDMPGEWYLDRSTGVLYFWPPADIKSSTAFVSMIDTIVALKDVSHVTLRGLHLEFNRGTAMVITGGSDNLVGGCTLRNIGGRAVTISGGTAHGVVGCDIHDTGDGGITLSGGDRATLTPAGHYAVNNHIHRYSRTSKTYRTGVSADGVGNRIAHNLIHDAPHMAIGLSGNEHVVEFNEVHTVCMDTDDAGAFYMGRDWTWRGNVIRHNYFHHIGSFSGHLGVQAIYLDDWASGATVYGNICYKAGRAVLIGGGRNVTVENNVFVECTPAVHIDSRGLGWAKNYFDGTTNTLTERLNAVPYREPPWSTRYPELLTLYDDEPAVAKYNVVARNICVGGRWLDLADGLNDTIVRVKDNLVDTDPHFVDMASGNFDLRDDSPAFELGFQRIPVERIGVYRDDLRASWPPG